MREKFAMLPESVWMTLPARHRLHAFLAQHAEGGAWFGRQEPLAKRLGLDQRTIRRALTALDADGLVECFRTAGRSGKGFYVVVVAALVPDGQTAAGAAARLAHEHNLSLHPTPGRWRQEPSCAHPAPSKMSGSPSPADERATSSGSTGRSCPVQPGGDARTVVVDPELVDPEVGDNRAPRGEGECSPAWLASTFKALNENEPMLRKGVVIGVSRVMTHLRSEGYTAVADLVAPVVIDALTDCPEPEASKRLREALVDLLLAAGLAADLTDAHDLYGRLAAGETPLGVSEPS